VDVLAKKTKGQQWFTIIAPKLFDSMEIGQTPVIEPKNLVGRKISVGLTDLVRDYRKYYMKFIFKVTSVDGDKALTEFDGSECMRDYISRLVIRWARRIDTIQDLTTKDGVNLRVKCVSIIPRRVKSSIKSAVRNEVRRIVKEDVENSTFDEFVQDILGDGMKKNVIKNTRRIYPIKSFEIRKTEVMPKPK
jgi:small subunit ribosomal protein S3Ae